MILIQPSNSQCNHREYAINGESLQSIARRVYSYTSPTLHSSSLALLQLLRSIPPVSSCLLLSASFTLKPRSFLPPPSFIPSLLPLFANHLLLNHISPSLIPAQLPCIPFLFTSTSLPSLLLINLSSLSSPPPPNLLTLSPPRSPFPHSSSPLALRHLYVHPSDSANGSEPPNVWISVDRSCRDVYKALSLTALLWPVWGQSCVVSQIERLFFSSLFSAPPLSYVIISASSEPLQYASPFPSCAFLSFLSSSLHHWLLFGLFHDYSFSPFLLVNP